MTSKKLLCAVLSLEMLRYRRLDMLSSNMKISDSVLKMYVDLLSSIRGGETDSVW